MSISGRERLFLPVRRKLASFAMAYLAGVYLSVHAQFPAAWTLALCAFLLGWAFLRLARRKSALLFVMGIFLLAGNGIAGYQISVRDLPTQPGVHVTGRIAAVEKPYRVYLKDVLVDGEPRIQRAVLVTLMREDSDEEPLPDASVGQLVSGYGRLFAPEEVRNPGGIDQRIRALADGYELSGYILPGWTVEGTACFSLWEWFRCLRERMLARTASIFGERAALFQGIMLGDKSAISSEVSHAMRLTGTVHVLTVSGMHLGMIAEVLSALLRKLGAGRYVRFGVLGGALGFFSCLTGGAAGTVRALIMALLREWARIRGRTYEPLTALSFAALIMTLIRPLWALDASFQFSFFVMLGIILLGQGISAYLNRLHMPDAIRRSLEMVSVSATAQIAALPMQLMFYGYVPLLALPMNFLCGMLMPVLLLGGWLCTLASVFPAWVYDLPVSALGMISGRFEAASVAVASSRLGVLRLPAPYAASVFLFAALMALLSCRIRFGKRRRIAALCTALLLAVAYLPRVCPLPRYVQLDVGQGDAALFRSGRHAVLVDVGPANSYDMLRYLRHEGLFVDAVVLSHLDEDHAGALAVLLDSEVDIPCVIMAEGAWHDDVSQDVLAGLKKLEAQGIAVHEVRRGDRIHFGSLVMDVYSPDELRLGSNERSLLLHASMSGTDFLLTGDLPQESEPENIPRCDVLKVAHHGSAKAISDAFLARARPTLSLISVGKDNRYGHPARRVLDALDSAGSAVLRTDENGCITLWLRDGIWYIQRYLESSRRGDSAYTAPKNSMLNMRMTRVYG